jgi:hypothetical protein
MEHFVEKQSTKVFLGKLSVFFLRPSIKKQNHL